MSNIVEISSAEFEQRVLRSPLPVLVDFFAVTCGPCRLLAPILGEVASELKGGSRSTKWMRGKHRVGEPTRHRCLADRQCLQGRA